MTSSQSCASTPTLLHTAQLAQTPTMPGRLVESFATKVKPMLVMSSSTFIVRVPDLFLLSTGGFAMSATRSKFQLTVRSLTSPSKHFTWLSTCELRSLSSDMTRSVMSQTDGPGKARRSETDKRYDTTTHLKGMVLRSQLDLAVKPGSNMQKLFLYQPNLLHQNPGLLQEHQIVTTFMTKSTVCAGPCSRGWPSGTDTSTVTRCWRVIAVKTCSD
jgi:hypothetical protein